MENPSMLSNCTSGGCGAKIGPGELSGILSALPRMSGGNLIVGFDTQDDAAVYDCEGTAIVSTVDFFSPMVDDPLVFGRIAAANAMSDVYAMGGEVLFALNLVCFPEEKPFAMLKEILRGGAEKVLEAGAVLAGGHSIYDKEIKYGLAVTGRVDKEKLLRNNTCRDGDLLILTKALGVGLVMAAKRGGLAEAGSVEAALASMQRLNKYAAEHFGGFEVHACTDVTGFGLAVHAGEMMGQNHSVTIYADALPVLPQARRYADEFLLTAAAQRNRNHMKDCVCFRNVSFSSEELLFDPQTSGGLLLSVSPGDAPDLLSAIKETESGAALIGEVHSRENYTVIVE
jgi:selenide,water dikinase